MTRIRWCLKEKWTMSKRRLAFAQSVRKTEALAKNHHEAWFDSWSSRIYRFKNTELLVVHIFAVSAPIWSCMWSGRVLQAGIACQNPNSRLWWGYGGRPGRVPGIPRCFVKWRWSFVLLDKYKTKNALICIKSCWWPMSLTKNQCTLWNMRIIYINATLWKAHVWTK